MERGRPRGSLVRNNIVEIIYFLKQAHGYNIYKIYRAIYPSVTMRCIYYHLKKGAEIGEFKVSKIGREKGNYSWGGTAEKIYYSLGKNAKPICDERVRDYLKKTEKGFPK